MEKVIEEIKYESFPIITLNLLLVYSWGEGDDGKLGHNNRVNYDRPKLIEALSGLGVVDIACGSAHSACITSSGNVFTWGKGR